MFQIVQFHQLSLTRSNFSFNQLVKIKVYSDVSTVLVKARIIIPLTSNTQYLLPQNFPIVSVEILNKNIICKVQNPPFLQCQNNKKEVANWI